MSLEKYLNGTSEKYINRTIEICGDEIQVNTWSKDVVIKYGKAYDDEDKRRLKEYEIGRKMRLGIEEEMNNIYEIDTLDEFLDFTSKKFEDEDKRREHIKEQNGRRRKKRVRQLVDCNWSKYSKMITLTFKENIIDRKVAHLMFGKFTKKLAKYLGEKLRYLSVVERQKRGAIHYHMCLFNNTFIPRNDLIEMWVSCGGGFQLDIRAKQDLKDKDGNPIVNVGSYIAKYMAKDLDTDALYGDESDSKRYFTSKGLKKPIVVRDNICNNNKNMQKLIKYVDVVYIGEVYESEDCYVKTYQVSKYRFKSDLHKEMFFKEFISLGLI